jgi:P-type Cu+ transporter
MQQDDKTAVVVSADGKVIGAIGLLDMAKQGTKEAVTALKSLGIEPVMLTGDNKRTAEEITRMVWIERVFAGVLLSCKVDIVKKIQLQEGKRGVAMVGHGIN